MNKEMLDCGEVNDTDSYLGYFSPDEVNNLRKRGIVGVQARRFNKEAVERKVDYLVNDVLKLENK